MCARYYQMVKSLAADTPCPALALTVLLLVTRVPTNDLATLLVIALPATVAGLAVNFGWYHTVVGLLHRPTPPTYLIAATKMVADITTKTGSHRARLVRAGAHKSRSAVASATPGRVVTVYPAWEDIAKYHADQAQAILAHEVGHFGQPAACTGRLVGGMLQMALLAVTADAILHNTTRTLLVLPIILAITLAGKYTARRWARKMEHDADLFAKSAGYADPLAEYLESITPSNALGTHNMFATHPSMHERISLLRTTALKK
jgi:Zn-dependent protease with chaperone function